MPTKKPKAKLKSAASHNEDSESKAEAKVETTEETNLEPKSHLVDEVKAAENSGGGTDPAPQTQVTPPTESESAPQTSPTVDPQPTNSADPASSAFSGPTVETPPVVSTVANDNANPIVINTSDSVADPEPEPSKVKKILQIAGIAVLVAALAVGLYFLYNNFVNKPKAMKSTTPKTSQATTPPTASPEATPPAPEIDLSKYPVKILNGSGKAGVAGKLKTELVAAGFNVTGTGNAKNSDYKLTEMHVASDVPQEFTTKLKDALAKSYKLSTESAALSSSEGTSAEVIIGSTPAN